MLFIILDDKKPTKTPTATLYGLYKSPVMAAHKIRTKNITADQIFLDFWENCFGF